MNYKIKSKGTTYYFVKHCMKDIIKWASESSKIQQNNATSNYYKIMNLVVSNQVELRES